MSTAAYVATVGRDERVPALLAELDELRYERDVLERANERLVELLADLMPVSVSPGRCIYCATHTWREARACPAHRDLLDLDPHTATRNRLVVHQGGRENTKTRLHPFAGTAASSQSQGA